MNIKNIKQHSPGLFNLKRVADGSPLKALEVFNYIGEAELVKGVNVYYFPAEDKEIAINRINEFLEKHPSVELSAEYMDRAFYGGIIVPYKQYIKDPKSVQSADIEEYLECSPTTESVVVDKENGYVFTPPSVMIINYKQ